MHGMEVPLVQDWKFSLELWILLLPELRTTPIFTSTPGSHCSLLWRGIVEKGEWWVILSVGRESKQ
jgi:hypothetical protein